MLPVVDVGRGVVEGVRLGKGVDGDCGAGSNVDPAAMGVLPETAPVLPTSGVVLHDIVRKSHGAAEHAQAAAVTVAVGIAAGDTGGRNVLVYRTVVANRTAEDIPAQSDRACQHADG